MSIMNFKLAVRVLLASVRKRSTTWSKLDVTSHPLPDRDIGRRHATERRKVS